jgi:hypothetical protein
MKKIFIPILMLFVFRPAIYAQEMAVEIGTKLGVPLTRVVDPLSATSGLYPVQSTDTGPPRIAVAPSLALTVAERATIELDAVFKPVRFGTVEAQPCCTFVQSVRATSFEFPLFVAYRVPHRWNPFLGGGFVIWDKAWGRVDHHNTFHDRGELETRVTTPYRGVNVRNLTPPFVLGGGLEFKASVFGLRPELRYTHGSGRNNLDLFLGFSFRALHAKRKP